jgi:hypothetical protein
VSYNSHYISTFQELILSPRRLVFTNSQMYFECATMHSLEVLHSKCTASLSPDWVVDRDAEYFQSFLHAFHETSSVFVNLYGKLCEYYRRELSFKEDIVKAVIGVVNASEDRSDKGQLIHSTHFNGVPLSFDPEVPTNTPTATFLKHMAWSYPGNKLSQLSDARTDLFPSWSWASIKAQ